MNILYWTGERSGYVWALLILVGVILVPAVSAEPTNVRSLPYDQLVQSDDWKKGKKLYQNLCIDCHGDMGQGVADKYDETLFGDRSLLSLTKLIEETMPEKHPEKCVDDEAFLVSQYIFEAFYSPEARARNNPPRRQLARLTADQFIHSITDIFDTLSPRGAKMQAKNPGGLEAKYYKSRRFRGNELVSTQTDERIAFQWDQGVPHQAIEKPEEFSIQWTGSLIAPVTGDYQISLITENGAKLWVNDLEEPLIDSWVSSAYLKKEVASLFLIGGRHYPVRLDFFKFKDKSSSIRLEWSVPGYAREVVEGNYLSSDQVVSKFLPHASFPPDDYSLGFNRGVSVSIDWLQSVNRNGLRAGQYLASNLSTYALTKPDDPDARHKVINLLDRFASLAFIDRLTPEDRHFFIESHIPAGATWNDIEDGVIKSVLLIVQSPKFLYPDIGTSGKPDFAVARALSLALWDSVPDPELLRAASSGELDSELGIRAQIQRMLSMPGASEKIDQFFHHWLELDEAEDIDKDPKKFPGFDEVLVSDLKKSLHLSIHDAVWSQTSDFRQLLLDNHIYVNRRLADFYRIEGIDLPADDTEFIPVQMEADIRSGVLSHPLVLSTFSYYSSTSPIHRGVFMTRKILGRFLKPPPMAIEFMDGTFNPHLTMRQKVTDLTSRETCMACHKIINPLGFSLENFDAVGRFQTHENDNEIDPASDYVDVDGKLTRFTSPRDVGIYAAGNRLAHLGFIDQLFHHLMKNPAAAYGPQIRNSLLESFQNSDYNILNLVEEIVFVAISESEAEPEE